MTGARALLALLLVIWPAALQAKTLGETRDKALGTFGAWRTWRSNDGGQEVCYMTATRVLKSTGPQRGQRYLMITHRPVEASTDVFSYGAGDMLEGRHGARLTAGKKTFELFSVRDIAWARDSMTDHAIAAALRKDATARLTGYVTVKKHLRPVSDTFDLTGANAAYAAIGRACGLSAFMPKKTPPKIAAKPVKKAPKHHAAPVKKHL
ncbi:MAG: hypothetical protein P4M15_14350 [Alphaproteobacteria bacterium]|nr:hypothetical protein [Alphaproteobacteria bacterium]